MEILDSTMSTFAVDDDLLNFTLDGEEEENPIKNVTLGGSSSETWNLVPTTPFRQDTQSGSFPEFEEDLEWLSNKDAFPAVETCFDILNDNPEFMLNHESPVSVLENSFNSNNNSNVNGNGNGNVSSITSCCESLKVPTNFPVRARSKRDRSRRKAGYGNFPIQQCVWSSQVNVVKIKQPMCASGVVGPMGRKCLHCQTDKTPQWRAGPMGPKTLCNACGVRYKSGRLLPEYRPASSPTFSSSMHSNSHRKVVDMRRQKQLPVGCGGGMVANEAH